MAENDPKLTPGPAASSDPFSLIIGGLRNLAGVERACIELQPELPRAVPMTMKCDDGIRYLIGLQFETAAEAEKFADGLAAFCDRDGERLILKKPPMINRDEGGNCFGVE